MAEELHRILHLHCTSGLITNGFLFFPLYFLVCKAFYLRLFYLESALFRYHLHMIKCMCADWWVLINMPTIPVKIQVLPPPPEFCQYPCSPFDSSPTHPLVTPLSPPGSDRADPLLTFHQTEQLLTTWTQSNGLGWGGQLFPATTLPHGRGKSGDHFHSTLPPTQCLSWEDSRKVWSFLCGLDIASLGWIMIWAKTPNTSWSKRLPELKLKPLITVNLINSIFNWMSEYTPRGCESDNGLEMFCKGLKYPGVTVDLTRGSLRERTSWGWEVGWWTVGSGMVALRLQRPAIWVKWFQRFWCPPKCCH